MMNNRKIALLYIIIILRTSTSASLPQENIPIPNSPPESLVSSFIPPTYPSDSIWNQFTLWGAFTGATVFTVAFMAIPRVLGFTAKGIQLGSCGARMMYLSTREGAYGVIANLLVPVCQSAGAGGICSVSFVKIAIIISVGAVLGFGTGFVVKKIDDEIWKDQKDSDPKQVVVMNINNHYVNNIHVHHHAQLTTQSPSVKDTSIFNNNLEGLGRPTSSILTNDDNKKPHLENKDTIETVKKIMVEDRKYSIEKIFIEKSELSFNNDTVENEIEIETNIHPVFVLEESQIEKIKAINFSKSEVFEEEIIRGDSKTPNLVTNENRLNKNIELSNNELESNSTKGRSNVSSFNSSLNVHEGISINGTNTSGAEGTGVWDSVKTWSVNSWETVKDAHVNAWNSIKSWANVSSSSCTLLPQPAILLAFVSCVMSYSYG